MTAQPSRVVILDRDGVLNDPAWDPEDGRHEGPLRAADVTLARGAIAGCRLLIEADWKLAVASNQPGAAKGKATAEEVEAVHDRVVALLADGGVEIPTWRYCHHHPQATDPALRTPCACRKPQPGMLLDILRDAHADPASSWMVGDADGDSVAARAAGCQAALVEHPLTAHRRSGTVTPDLRGADLHEIAAAILRTVQ